MAGRWWAVVCVPGPGGSDRGAGTSHCRTAAHQTVGHALGMLQTIIFLFLTSNHSHILG